MFPEVPFKFMYFDLKTSLLKFSGLNEFGKGNDFLVGNDTGHFPQNLPNLLSLTRPFDQTSFKGITSG